MRSTTCLLIGGMIALVISSSAISYNLANETTLQKILALPPYFEPQFQNFTILGGEWNAEDEHTVSVAAGDGPKLLCSLEPFANLTTGEVSVEILFPETGRGRGYQNAGILLKVREAGVGADNFIGYEIAPSWESQHVNIGLHRHDYRKIADYPYTIPAGEWITLHVLFDATSFEVRLDDKFITKYNVPASDRVRSGAVALRPWQSAVKYRNLQIKKENEPWETISFQMVEPAEEEQNWLPTLATENLPPILFLTRHPLARPHVVGNDVSMGLPTAPGCSIRIMYPAEPEREFETIFSDPTGSIFDINLSADAQTVYFSYMRRGERYWNLWRIGTDGTGLRQLTDGNYFDVSPCETPAGDVIFVSTRRFGHTVCQPGPASNLHRLRNFAPGETPTIDCISMNTLSDMTPQMMRDGRVLFTRWEYIDRDLTYRQSLWTQNPDGTGYQLFFGNTVRDVGSFMQTRQLPETNHMFVSTFAPHHGFPHGMIGLIDRSAGIEGDKGKGFIYITTDVESVGDTDFPWGYRDPFPLTDELFLCSYGGARGYYQDGKRRFGLYLLDIKGNKRLLFEDEEQSCVFPIPFVPVQPGAVIADRVQVRTPADKLNDPDDATLFGTVTLMDVNEGLQGRVERGTITSLRIMEQIRKSEDLFERAYDQSPVMSYATYYAKRDWGTVPIESDGSAHFTAPALREIYLQALDSEGREVFRMMSAFQLMPGEQLSCAGCHEDRDTAAVRANRVPIASRKPPHVPQSPDWLLRRERLNEFPDARVFDYPSVVQPVLDKYCIECHHGERAEGGYDLTGDKTRYFSMSYDNLLGTSRSYRQHNMLTGEMLPGEVAKGKPLVHYFWLLHTPSSQSSPYITGSHASRLTELIESEHGGVTMPLEDRQKIYYWMDANVLYYGTYANARSTRAAGQRDRFADPVSGRLSPWAEQFLEVYQRRCTDCHGQFRLWEQAERTGQFAWLNLSRPSMSAALTAHLPLESGGRGIAAVKEGKRVLAELPEQFLFMDKNDADYLKMLNALEEGKRIMLANPEADMPGFRKARAEP